MKKFSEWLPARFAMDLYSRDEEGKRRDILRGLDDLSDGNLEKKYIEEGQESEDGQTRQCNWCGEKEEVYDFYVRYTHNGVRKLDLKGPFCSGLCLRNYYSPD